MTISGGKLRRPPPPQLISTHPFAGWLFDISLGAAISNLNDPEFVEEPWLDRLSDKEREEHLDVIEAFQATPPADLDILHGHEKRTVQTAGIWREKVRRS